VVAPTKAELLIILLSMYNLSLICPQHVPDVQQQTCIRGRSHHWCDNEFVYAIEENIYFMQ